MRALTSLLILAPCAAVAFQFPIKLPFLKHTPFQTHVDTNVTTVEDTTHRIAIIGAGAGGSSAAFWLSKAQNRSDDLGIAIDVFEKEAYIGGRSTIVHPYDSEEYDPVELGASIFVAANKNLWRATEEFNLSLVNYDGEDGELGIWDGSIFRFRAKEKGGSFGWWDMVRLIWRYGVDAPRRSSALVKSMVENFVTLYNPETPSWQNVTAVSSYLSFENFTAQTMASYMDAQNINTKYTSEIIEAMTRVNYGQNVDQIHALEGLVSQAASGASSVKGGNYQIFEQFLSRSSAKLHLNTTVTSLTKKSKKWTLVTKDGVSRTYDSVILAAPFHSTNIKISPKLRTPIPKQPYLHLHVTLIATSSPMPNPEYFSLSPGSNVPNTILTTNDAFVHGGSAPEFNSLSYHGEPAGHGGRPAEYIVKIFSSKSLDDTWLRGQFGKVGWVLRKEWDAYPLLPPTTVFPPVKPEEGLYYVNSFEPFISTMETETISSQNAVQLLITDVWGTNATACPQENGTDQVVMKGWDC